MPRSVKSSNDKHQPRAVWSREGEFEKRGGGKPVMSRRIRFSLADWDAYEGDWKSGGSRRRQQIYN